MDIVGGIRLTSRGEAKVVTGVDDHSRFSWPVTPNPVLRPRRESGAVSSDPCNGNCWMPSTSGLTWTLCRPPLTSSGTSTTGRTSRWTWRSPPTGSRHALPASGCSCGYHRPSLRPSRHRGRCLLQVATDYEHTDLDIALTFDVTNRDVLPYLPAIDGYTETIRIRQAGVGVLAPTSDPRHDYRPTPVIPPHNERLTALQHETLPTTRIVEEPIIISNTPTPPPATSTTSRSRRPGSPKKARKPPTSSKASATPTRSPATNASAPSSKPSRTTATKSPASSPPAPTQRGVRGSNPPAIWVEG